VDLNLLCLSASHDCDVIEGLIWVWV
jgi:hypothetical protein